MRKKLGQYQEMADAPIASHTRAVVRHAVRYHRLTMFEPGAFWGWVRSYLRSVFGRKHPFLGPETLPGRSRYRLPAELRISLAGDWGTGTDEAAAVAAQMMRWPGGGAPDLTIHLGDVYYVGDPVEVRENCLGGAGTRRRPRECVAWPIGTLGSFALNGNHEMFAKGRGYFEAFLPALGLRDAAGRLPGQGVSFFCLENEDWRIIGLDTGYNSAGPALLALWVEGDCALPPELVRWLREIIPPGSPPKPTIILSHHQYFSGFDRQYPVPARQLEEFFHAPVLWLWGHEHKLAGYKLFGSGELQVHGRCLGHGGMPIEPSYLRGDRASATYLLFHDARVNPRYARDRLGFNGFARLHLEGKRLTIEYCSLVAEGDGYAEEPEVLVREVFTADGPRLSPPRTEILSRDPAFFTGASHPSSAAPEHE